MSGKAASLPLPPRRVAVRMHYSMIGQFMLYWVKHDRPCDLTVKRSRRDNETIGVCLDVSGNAESDMLREIKAMLGVDIVDLR